ncbi:MAG TPA: cellulase family glycosylhydrolase, partial [Candidatus Saccharimonadales bacterium]|nr:cellulase family glycosylhydrolase [Candidatus Saccharimonadales bacterium]
VIGVHLLLSSQAQSPYASIRADQGTLTAPATTKPCSGSSDGSCVQFGTPPTSAISFSVVGNKIMESNHTQFVPYGFVLECPAIDAPQVATNSIAINSKGSLCDGSDYSGNSGVDQIQAAATDWNANIVRLQVAQEALFNGTSTVDGTTGINMAYLTLINNLVTQANSLGMVATVTLQEEVDGSGSFAFPTASSTKFWTFMANYYKNNPEVFFDIYNEPSLDANAFPNDNATQAESDIWNIWQNGGPADTESKSGTVNTASTTDYVGMQSLVNTIRAQGANNIIIAEGPDHDKDLTQLLVTSTNTVSHQLTGSNIAYGVEPNLRDDNTQALQYARFGQVDATVPVVPEAFLDAYMVDTCWKDSPTDLPPLLAYLKSLNMGLQFWSLIPGIAIQGKNLDMPTTYGSATTIDCGSGTATVQSIAGNTIGYGQLVQSYFKANSVKL